MRRRPPGAPARAETGSATLEVAVLAPALLFVVFMVIQVALWSYARSLALGAAQEGVAAARAYQSSVEAGRVRAEEFLAASAGDSLLETEVTVVADRTTVRVEVAGRALSVLPGVPGLPVRQHALGPIERVTSP